MHANTQSRSAHGFDQAEGLRRILVRASVRIFSIVAARQGVGATTTVINLAAALARSGMRVLVLDENLTHDNVANSLSLKPRYDLLNAVRDGMACRDLLLGTACGVQVLPIARAMQALPALNDKERERLLECLTAASRLVDVILVDATTQGYSLCAGLGEEEPLLLLTDTSAEGITESYALLKQMAQRYGRKSFDLLFNRTRSAAEAQAVFDNMAQVARGHLRVELKHAGNIPADYNLASAARQHSTLVDVMPGAPAAAAYVELARNVIMPGPAAKKSASSIDQMLQRLLLQGAAMPMARAGQAYACTIR